MAEWIVKNLREVARFAGVRIETVKKDWLPAGMPRHQRPGARQGLYDYRLDEIFRWYREHYLQGGKPDELGQALRRAKLDEQVARARERRLRADRLASLVISRAEHERQIMLRSGWFKRVIDGLPTMLAVLVANKPTRQCREIIADTCRQIVRVGFGGQRSSGSKRDAKTRRPEHGPLARKKRRSGEQTK